MAEHLDISFAFDKANIEKYFTQSWSAFLLLVLLCLPMIDCNLLVL